MDADALALFGQSLRRATADAGGEGLDAALAGLGWHDALADDRRAAVSLLFELQGEAAATSSALGHVLADSLGLGAGDGPATVLPAAGGGAPPGTVHGTRVRIDGLAPAGLVDRDGVLVVATATDGTMTAGAVVTASLDLRPVVGIDRDAGLLRVTGDAEWTGHEVDVSAGSWAAAVAAGRRAVGHELVGASRTMLALACDHARQRVQFGRPIASFQAVRHRLADARVALAMAEASLEAAWLDPTPESSTMAKAVCGRQAKVVARQAQQVLAGIGFTVEHPFHRYVFRILLLDALLGMAASLTTTFGTELLERRRLPPLLPL